MNQVDFRHEYDPDPCCGHLIEPYVDGHRLLDLAASFEVVGSDGVKVGDFADTDLIGIQLRRMPSLHEYFIPSSAHPFRGERTPLLQCSCGTYGCGDLVCKIVVTEAVVEWREFDMPVFRQPRAPSILTGFGPFIFDLADYRAALDAFAAKHGVKAV